MKSSGPIGEDLPRSQISDKAFPGLGCLSWGTGPESRVLFGLEDNRHAFILLTDDNLRSNARAFE